VKPILETTEEVAGQTADQIAQSQRDAQQRAADAALSSATSRAESYSLSLQNSWPAGAREVRACVRDARRDAGAMEKCAEFGQTVVHTLQSDYNFANAYADSLDSGGRSADADRVRECVERAGFTVGPMERCRDLADKLLFE
jgi:hypothetical protein